MEIQSYLIVLEMQLVTFSAVYFHRARLAWSAMDCELDSEVGGGTLRVDVISGFRNAELESADLKKKKKKFVRYRIGHARWMISVECRF